MRLPTRTRHPEALPGVTGRARVVGRRDLGPLRGLRAGDVLVLDRTDLDRATAQAAIDAEVAAVVNAGSSISGRFPTLGAGLLADAGVVHVDQVGPRVFDGVRDGAEVRVHDGVVLRDEADVAVEVASGRVLDGTVVVELQGRARADMGDHLASLVLNSGEFLKREHRLLLHGSGLPTTATPMTGRPVVVVAAGHEHRAELRAVRSFVREQQPVVVAVDTGAVVAADVGMHPDVVVVSNPDDDRGLPPAAVLRRARDVVVAGPRGDAGDVEERLARLGITPLALHSAAAPEDAALLMAHHQGASALVGVGLHGTLEELLDGDRPGLAGAYLTRLEVGPNLVDAAALRALYAGRVGLRHVVAVMVVGLVALVAAILVTPVGQEWGAATLDWAAGTLSDLRGRVA